MTYPYENQEPPKRRNWFLRLLSRLHDRSDAIFLLGYLALLGYFAWFMHQNLF